MDKVVEFARKRVKLRLREGAAKQIPELLSKVPIDAPIAIIVGPDPSAQACFVWEPGGARVYAIQSPCHDGQLVAGNFIVFVPHAEQDAFGHIEDGFALQLQRETWKRLRDALMTRQAFTVDFNEKTSFAIDLAPELDADFVDPHESQVPGGWHVFRNDPAAEKNSEPGLSMRSISLLTFQQIMGRRIETAELTKFINMIQSTSVAHFATATEGPGQDVAIGCEVRPDGSRQFHLGFRPQIKNHSTAALVDELMQIAPPSVVGGPIRFQLNCQLRGGSGESKLS